MNEEPFDNTSKANTDEKDNKRRSAGLKGAKTKRTVGFRNVLAALSALFFCACFVNIRHWTSLLLTLAAVGCGAWAMKIEMEHRSHAHPTPRKYALMFCSIGLLVWIIVFLSLSPIPAPQPHFRWTLTTSDSSETNLGLTNSFLFFNGDIHDTNVHGHLMVPALSEQSIPELQFSLHNDSLVSAEMVVAQRLQSLFGCMSQLTFQNLSCSIPKQGVIASLFDCQRT